MNLHYLKNSAIMKLLIISVVSNQQSFLKCVTFVGSTLSRYKVVNEVPKCILKIA